MFNSREKGKLFGNVEREDWQRKYLLCLGRELEEDRTRWALLVDPWSKWRLAEIWFDIAILSQPQERDFPHAGLKGPKILLPSDRKNIRTCHSKDMIGCARMWANAKSLCVVAANDRTQGYSWYLNKMRQQWHHTIIFLETNDNALPMT